ncbi:hypothetical protein [Nonomuraea sp. SYSU D8015]|nr:hypothetical protein [Nonomuraea sp. SYSU D8015]
MSSSTLPAAMGPAALLQTFPSTAAVWPALTAGRRANAFAERFVPNATP